MESKYLWPRAHTLPCQLAIDNALINGTVYSDALIAGNKNNYNNSLHMDVSNPNPNAKTTINVPCL